MSVLRSLSASIARERNLVSVEVVYQRLHSSIILEIWRAAFPAPLDPDLQSLSGALWSFLSRSPWASPVLLLLLLLVWVPPSVRACPLAAVSCVPVLRRACLSEQLRQLAVQFASLASRQDVVAQSIQSPVNSPSGLVAPITADERALPASLSRPCSRSRSPLPKAAPNRR